MFENKTDKLTKTLTITPSNNSFTFDYEEKEGTKISVVVNEDDLLILQKMVKFAIPYILGWQHLSTPLSV